MILTAILVLLWAVCAAANASIFFRKRPGSMAPFVGGIFALLAFFACPWNGRLKPVLLALALVLDLGSLPFVVLLLVAAVSNADWWTALYGKFARLSWGVRLGIGFLLWLLVTGALMQAGETLGLDSDYVFNGASILFWLLYAIFLVRVWKDKR